MYEDWNKKCFQIRKYSVICYKLTNYDTPAVDWYRHDTTNSSVQFSCSRALMLWIGIAMILRTAKQFSFVDGFKLWIGIAMILRTAFFIIHRTPRFAVDWYRHDTTNSLRGRRLLQGCAVDWYRHDTTNSSVLRVPSLWRAVDWYRHDTTNSYIPWEQSMRELWIGIAMILRTAFDVIVLFQVELWIGIAMILRTAFNQLC